MSALGDVETLSARQDIVVASRTASPTLDRAYALARSGVCVGIADLKDRLIREGHGALEVIGLLSASHVARDIAQVIATSHANSSSRLA
jgi:hypothetical protein